MNTDLHSISGEFSEKSVSLKKLNDDHRYSRQSYSIGRDVMLKLNNSSNGSFDISANIHITMDSPKIQIQSGELAFVDISDNKYFSIDVSNQVIKINKTLDLSSNGNIVFNNDLNFISNKQNILSIKQKNNLPVISYSEKLIIQNTNTNEVYANPIIKYKVLNTKFEFHI